jgi:hypothetical protein
MAHLEYFTKLESTIPLSDYLDKLELAVQQYASFVLGEELIFNNKQSEEQRITDITHFIEALT